MIITYYEYDREFVLTVLKNTTAFIKTVTSVFDFSTKCCLIDIFDLIFLSEQLKLIVIVIF